MNLSKTEEVRINWTVEVKAYLTLFIFHPIAQLIWSQYLVFPHGEDWGNSLDQPFRYRPSSGTFLQPAIDFVQRDKPAPVFIDSIADSRVIWEPSSEVFRC